jgi:hypothetical protein
MYLITIAESLFSIPKSKKKQLYPTSRHRRILSEESEGQVKTVTL